MPCHPTCAAKDTRISILRGSKTTKNCLTKIVSTQKSKESPYRTAPFVLYSMIANLAERGSTAITGLCITKGVFV